MDRRPRRVARLLRIDARTVLNTDPPRQPAPGDAGVAAEIKRAVNAFKAAAMDPAGEHVNYSRLRESLAYEEYRRTCTPRLRTFNPATLATRQEQLAFWINLYNALVIDAVIALGVQRGVTEGLAGVVRFFRHAAYNVGGQRYSLEDIEHGVLRANRGHPYLPGPQFSPSDPRRVFVVAPLDPRIHFALNCASHSCPPIGVYTSEALESQLDLATRNFVGAQTTIDPARNELRLSSILRWYAADFRNVGGVIDFVSRYLPESEGHTWLTAHRGAVRAVYDPYNWSLNT